MLDLIVGLMENAVKYENIKPLINCSMMTENSPEYKLYSNLIETPIDKLNVIGRSGLTPAMEFISFSNIPDYIKNNVDVNIQSSKNGLTIPMISCIVHGYILDWILKYDIDYSLRDSDGDTIHIIYSKFCRSDMPVELQKTFNPNAQNKIGETANMFYVSKNLKLCPDWMMENYNDPEDNKGYTILSDIMLLDRYKPDTIFKNMGKKLNELNSFGINPFHRILTQTILFYKSIPINYIKFIKPNAVTGNNNILATIYVKNNPNCYIPQCLTHYLNKYSIELLIMTLITQKTNTYQQRQFIKKYLNKLINNSDSLINMIIRLFIFNVKIPTSIIKFVEKNDLLKKVLRGLTYDIINRYNYLEDFIVKLSDKSSILKNKYICKRFNIFQELIESIAEFRDTKKYINNFSLGVTHYLSVYHYLHHYLKKIIIENNIKLTQLNTKDKNFCKLYIEYSNKFPEWMQKKFIEEHLDINSPDYFIDSLSLPAYLLNANGYIPDWMVPLVNINLLFDNNNTIHYYYIKYLLPIPENLGCDYKTDKEFDINRKNTDDESIISLYIKYYQNDIPDWMKRYKIDVTKTFKDRTYLELFKEYCSNQPIPSWIIKYEIVEKDFDKSDKCVICMDSFNENQIVKTKCGHLFHKSCFDEMISSTCPVCRAIL